MNYTSRSYRACHLPFRLRKLIAIQQYLIREAKDYSAAGKVSFIRSEIMDRWLGR